MNTLSALTVIYGTGYDRQKITALKAVVRVSLEMKAYHTDLNIFYF